MENQSAKNKEAAAAAAQQDVPEVTPTEEYAQPEDPDQEESEDDSDVSSEDDLEESYQILVGKKINDQGNVVDKKSGVIIGKLVEGKVRKVVGRKVGERGAVVNSKGKILGRVEPVDEDSSSEEESESEEEEDVSGLNEGKVSEGGAPVEEPESREIFNASKDDESESENNIVDKVQDGAEDASKKTGDVVDKVKDDADDASKETGGVVDKAQDSVSDASKETGDVVDKAQDSVNDASKETGDFVDKAQDSADDVSKETEGSSEVSSNKTREINTHVSDIDIGDTTDDTLDSEIEDKSSIDDTSPVVKKSGKVLDMDDNVVGHVDKRLASKFTGFKVDSEGNVINHDGEIVGTADMIQPIEEEKPFNPNEMVDQDSPEVRKSGKVVDMEDNVVGSVEKHLASKLAGFKVDVEGNVINHEGHIVAKAAMIKTEPVEEDKPFNPNKMINEDSPEVKKSGKVLDIDDEVVGTLDKRMAIKYAGLKVDPEGNVIDSEGHIVAKAEMIKKEETVEEENKPFNPNQLINEDSPEVRKSGKIFDIDDELVGTLDKKLAVKYAGLKVDPEGNVIDSKGYIVAKAEMIQTPEEEQTPFNPYAMVDENSPEVKKSGKVVDMDDNIVGSVDKLIAHKLVGFKVDSEGNIINNEGHIAGKADMIKEEESESEEERPFNPNSNIDEYSPEVTRSGNVVDENNNVVGTVDEGYAGKWAGLKVDPYGNVIDKEGQTVGNAEMKKKVTEEEHKQQQQEEEYRRIATLMSQAVQQSLDKIKPVLKEITSSIEVEEAKTEKDRDEKKLVEHVKPLIEQGSQILGEANGAIRGLDPSGNIAKQAQANTSQRKALPEEYHLADLLSQLAGEVTTTIDNAKKKIKNMPHAKRELSPLWNILQSPLLQILSAVGLLLTGVLGLVGNILNGLGLGSIINSLLGGIGLNKILEGFGLGDALKLGRK